MRYLSIIIIFLVSLSSCDLKISQQETDKNGVDIIQTIFDMFQSRSNLPGKCSNLKRVHNIGELLNQVYEHVNDSCMYQASSKDLSDIWGVTVLKSSEFRKSNPKGKFISEINKYQKQLPCANRASPIIVDLNEMGSMGSDYMIIYTADCYKHTYGGFFETDPTLFSNQLPEPKLKESLMMPSPKKADEPDEVIEPIPNNAKLKPNHYYYWLHTSGKGLIYIRTEFSGYQAKSIHVDKNNTPDILY